MNSIPHSTGSVALEIFRPDCGPQGPLGSPVYTCPFCVIYEVGALSQGKGICPQCSMSLLCKLTLHCILIHTEVHVLYYRIGLTI